MQKTAVEKAKQRIREGEQHILFLESIKDLDNVVFTSYTMQDIKKCMAVLQDTYDLQIQKDYRGKPTCAKCEKLCILTFKNELHLRHTNNGFDT